MQLVFTYMEIYIEYAVIDNMVFNTIISVLTLYCLKLKIKVWRVIVAAVFGTLFAIFLPLIKITPFVLVPLKALCGCFMVYFLYPHKKVRAYIKAVAVFMLATLLLGGICFGLIFIIEKDFSKALNLNYSGGVPIGLIALGLFAGIIAVVRFVGWVQRFKSIKSFTYDIRLCALGRSAVLKAFLDSGNRLYDPLTNLPVVIIGLAALRRMFSAEIVGSMISGRDVGLKVRTISFDTVGGSGKLLLFAPQKIEIYFEDKVNILCDVMVGISYKAFEDDSYDALLHPALMR